MVTTAAAASASPRPDTLTVRSLTEMLAATLGWEKSAEVVNATALRLGLPPVILTLTQAAALLSELAKAPGMVGVTARFARSRMDLGAPPSAPTSGRASVAPKPSSDEPPPSSLKNVARSLLISELVGLLAGTVGQERAEDAVLEVVRRLGLPTRSLSRDQTLAVLDDLAVRPGLVGVTARFAKARAILLFGG
jgi:hypothetical protein